MAKPTLIVFLGGFGSSEVERLVDDARKAAVFAAIDTWLDAPSGQGLSLTDGEETPAVVIATDGPSVTCTIPRVIVDHDAGAFHFGRRLAEVIRHHRAESVIYIGGGSMPLFTASDYADVSARLTGGVAVTNNFFSSDLIAFPVTERVLEVVATVERDNSLARALKEQAGLEVQSLERTVATLFDIDTPADIAILKLTGEGSPFLQVAIEGANIDLSRYKAVLPYFLDVKKQIVVAGRVGTQAWSYLERETACRVRLFAEERGMEADGRAASGQARSLLGYYIDAVGVGRFFETLVDLGDAAFIDTRVLLAHKRIEASREDRFLSDLGRWDGIRDPFMREFTHGAVESPIPVLLGGHSLMAGGLMALNEYAWRTLGDARPV
jgi:hypothetical protein